LAHTDLLKLNEEELDTLAAMHTEMRNADDFVAFLCGQYGIETVAVTRGPRGGSLFTAQGRLDAAACRIDDLIDTVGAGDAFAAVLAAGYLRGLPPRTTLDAATRLAASLCTVAGAIPEDDGLYADVRQQIER
jgi:fructokinase